MTYNIVEVVPGKYAIRRRTFFEELFNIEGEFLDLVSRNHTFWWNQSDDDFEDCLADAIEPLVLKLELLKAFPKVIL